MVGDGPDRNLVETVIQSHAGGKKVKLTGALLLPEVLALLPTAHVIVLMSEFEGNPISLMEGMAAGLVPVVTPMLSGIPELVLDGDTGFLVKDRSSAFVAAIHKLQQNPKLWRAMSESASQHFAASFSPESVVEAWCRQIGKQPAPFTLPEEIHFPVNSWLEFWVDGSMGKGLRRYCHIAQGKFWKMWDSVSPQTRGKLRACAKKLLMYDGLKLKNKKILKNNHELSHRVGQ
jgi:hypothetical protein